MLIKLSAFSGVIPSIDSTMLPDGAAQVASDCKTGSGALKPFRSPVSVTVPTMKTGSKKTIWLYDDSGTRYWLHWQEEVNAVKSPLPSDSFKRIYWTGEGIPKMAPLAYAITGGTGYPVASYQLGLPSPTAPSAARVGTPGSDQTLDESRSYVIRYVSAYGEVGPPSSASNIVVVSPGNSVTVTLPTEAPSGLYHVASLDIFRTNTGTSTTEYQYVGNVALGVPTYSDVKDSSALGFVLDSVDYLAPPSALSGLITLPNGSLAGFYNNVLCVSVPHQPHAWPAAGQYSMADKIISIGAFGNSILVTTAGAPYVATGSSYDAMSVERFEEGEACVSKRATVDMGYAVIYPTPIGLRQVGVGGSKMLTAGVCTIDEWKLLQMDSANTFAMQYGDKYLAFTPAGTYMFNPTDGTYITLSSASTGTSVTAGYYEQAAGKLFLCRASEINQFDGSGSAIAATWKSKKFTAPYPVNIGALQVFASGAVTVNVYADGTLKHTAASISTNIPVRLPSGYRATHWEVEIISSSIVQQVLLATTMAELSQV